MDAVANETPCARYAATDTATFTKWLVGEGPIMAGVVGGAARDGTFVGKVLDLAPTDHGHRGDLTNSTVLNGRSPRSSTWSRPA